MIFSFLSFVSSHQIFNISPDSLKSLTLYFHPQQCIEVKVTSNLHTYFSDMQKANGLTLEIQVNDSSSFGPFDYRSHLDGIHFNTDYVDYNLVFTNNGNNDIHLAMVFEHNLESSLKIINQNFFNDYFPITNYLSKKFIYFNNEGLIFHEKKYSLSYFIGLSIALFILFVSILIIGFPKVMNSLDKSHK